VFDEVPTLVSTSTTKGFQVKSIFRRWFTKGKNRITRRLDKKKNRMTGRPTFNASNIQFEVSDKIHAIACGGIGAIHSLVRRIGLIDAIDQHLHLLKFHLPYHESEHVLNFAYNVLCNGTCLQDIELRRNDENYLDALGMHRIPDPTTAGDFCRRFTLEHIDTFIDIVNEVRLKVWAEQPDDFFECAKIDMDGTIVETAGERKEGIDISYKGAWGYHPLALTLANTGEVLSPGAPGSIARETDRRTKALPKRRTASCNCAAKPAFAKSSCAATPIFPRRVISMAGTATRGFASTLATTPRRT
jgi:hypothetical protein